MFKTSKTYSVSERDFERDAQRVCKAERSLKSPLAGTKRCVRLATNNVINPSNCQLLLSISSQTPGKIALHVRYISWQISLSSSEKQQREVTKFCVF